MLDLVNSAAMNMGMHGSLPYVDVISFEYTSRKSDGGLYCWFYFRYFKEAPEGSPA